MVDYGDWGEKPLPIPDPESEAFWDAAADGDLVLQRCDTCGEHQFYPRQLCRHCWSRDLRLEPAAGSGTVYSYTRCHVPGQPGYSEETPYTVALIELDLPADNPSGRPVRMTSHVVDCPPADIEVGLPVEVDFEEVGVDPSFALPVFRPR